MIQATSDSGLPPACIGTRLRCGTLCLDDARERQSKIRRFRRTVVFAGPSWSFTWRTRGPKLVSTLFRCVLAVVWRDNACGRTGENTGFRCMYKAAWNIYYIQTEYSKPSSCSSKCLVTHHCFFMSLQTAVNIRLYVVSSPQLPGCPRGSHSVLSVFDLVENFPVS